MGSLACVGFIRVHFVTGFGCFFFLFCFFTCLASPLLKTPVRNLGFFIGPFVEKQNRQELTSMFEGLDTEQGPQTAVARASA